MRLLNNAIAIALMIGLGAALGHAQDKVAGGGAAFPSNSDINLVVLQADAVMDQY